MFELFEACGLALCNCSSSYEVTRKIETKREMDGT